MELQGTFAYLVSPIRPDGSVDTAVHDRLVHHLIASGVEGLTPLGSTGEVAYLTAEQRRAVVAATVKSASGRVPVVPGVEAFSTASAIAQARSYEAMGVDGLVLMLSTYFPVSPAGTASYFRDVARSVAIPVGLYFNPQFVGGGLSLDLLERLQEIPNIQFIKEASGNTGLLLSVQNRFRNRFRLFGASAHIPLVILMMGGVGWMGGPVCLLPELSRRLVDLGRSGRIDEAWPLQRRLWAVNAVFQKHGLAACVKAGLEMQGFAVGRPLAPQEPLSEAAEVEIRDALALAAEG